MVSRQEGTLFSTKRDLTIFGEEIHNSFKKTKLEDQSQGKPQSTLFNERPNSESMRSVTFDFKLHLHAPLPSDWEKSIEPKGYSRTSEDHRTDPKDSVVVGRPKMSLDLELNLSPSKTITKIDESTNHNETSSNGKKLTSQREKTTLPWLALEGGDDDDEDDDDKEQEMVTKVCMKCHMLVMMSTSNPVCPNCKFMHPHDNSSTKLFRPPNLLRLLC